MQINYPAAASRQARWDLSVRGSVCMCNNFAALQPCGGIRAVQALLLIDHTTIY